MRSRLPEPVAELVRAQAGVVSRHQLLGAGLSSSAAHRFSRDWTTVAPGVYVAVPVIGEPTFEARVWAGILLGGGRARAAGSTAAILHGLADGRDFPDARGRRGRTANTQPGVIEVLTDRQVAAVDGFWFRRERLGCRLPSPAAEPPRTTVADTVLDLCAATGDPDQVIAWVSRACQRKLVKPAVLRKRVRARPTARHRALILAALTGVTSGATTLLEQRALEDVIRAHDLPEPVMQAATGTGAVADAVFEGYGLLVEYDGRLGHEAEGRFRDMQRDNAHQLRGWSTLRFGWADIQGDPCGAARQITALLRAAGWAGTPAGCSRCPAPGGTAT